MPCQILLYGFSSASVLIKGLQTGEIQPPTQPQGSRSALIRDLSVFISHLESMARPGQSNHLLLDSAARAFARIIDEILEPRSVMDEVVQSDAGRDIGNEIEVSMFLGLNELDMLETMSFAATLDQTMF